MQTSRHRYTITTAALANEIGAVRRYSSILGEWYWIVSGPVPLQTQEAVYRIEELDFIREIRQDTELLKAVNQVKKTFQGRVVEIRATQANVNRGIHTRKNPSNTTLDPCE